ncbi:hypothetical protein [Pseudomonas syringae]|uniref:hypothetical protein n=1 Tax=Pseudomonas syringae TaxID=317 RepID=UPI000422A080|nr:hypothetical protein [Pseudomonas syringae]
MKKYLIKRIFHRLDGISLASCHDTGSDRTVSLRYRTAGFELPLVAGRMYLLRTSARSNGVNLVAVLECGVDASGWDELIKNSFFIDSFHLPPKAKKLLLSQSLGSREVLLESLTSGDMLPWCNVLLEPERTLLGLSFQESLSRYQRIKRVMAWGLAQIHAERFYETYGSQAYESSSAQVKALLAFASQNERRAALSSTGAKLSPDQRTVLEAMGWFLEQIRGERTLFRETDVPVKLKEGLRLSANAGWVITDGDHYQLKSNANLQVAVRRQLERLSRNFFPTYTADEIRYSYSRYSQVVASYSHIDYEDEITAAVNSRISIIRPQDLKCLHEFMAQLSGVLQILYASAPLVVVYSSGLSSMHELHAEKEPIPFYRLPQELPKYSTIMVTDCDLFSLSDFLITLQNIPETSRLVLIDSRRTKPGATPHFIDGLARYFAALDVQRNVMPQRLTPNQDSICPQEPFNVRHAEQCHRGHPEEVFVSDHPALVDAINQRLTRTRSPIVLETQDRSFRKYDRVWLRPAYSSKWDPFICTLHSVSAKGLFVEMDGRFLTLSKQLVQDAVVALGFAMSPTAAVQTRALSVVLIASRPHKEEWIAYLVAYGLKVTDSFPHDLAPSRPFTKGLAYQRLAPLVE